MHLLLIAYSSYCLFIYSWIALAIAVFFLLLRVTAPYGRHSSLKWGPTISNRLGWVIMELPVLLLLWIYLAPVFHSISLVSWVMISLFCLHYLNRTFIFPFRLHTRGKKMPLIIVLSAILFNLVNGFSLGYYFAHYANYANSWFTDIRFICGFILFFAGMYINLRTDDQLIHLRKPGETHYVIPRNGLFEWVSCPNLLGELIEWLGFALLCWNLPAWGFFIWTAANLIPRAISHHSWYRNTFADYPANRKAIVPFVL